MLSITLHFPIFISTVVRSPPELYKANAKKRNWEGFSLSEKNREYNPSYTLRMARNLIFASYKEAGIERPIEYFEKSPLASDLGSVKSEWNEGLFRLLDEAVNILNTIEYSVLSSMLKNGENSLSSLVILIHQVKSNCASIRVLGASGLDSQARLSLRALYENSVVFCRALVDEEFRSAFKNVKNAKEANVFWHSNIARSKSEKFLIRHNEISDKKCLIAGADYKDIYERVGVSAHPNYFASQFEYSDRIFNKSNKMFLGGGAATEFVLTGAILLSLAVVVFLSLFREEVCGDTPWFMGDQMFGHLRTNSEVISCLGKVSLLLTIFLMKWTNRQKPDFDEQSHI